MAYIGKEPQDAYNSPTKDRFSGDASTTAFTLSTTQTTANVIVSIEGALQQPTTSYAVSGTTLTFTQAPANGDVIEVRKINKECIKIFK